MKNQIKKISSKERVRIAIEELIYRKTRMMIIADPTIEGGYSRVPVNCKYSELVKKCYGNNLQKHYSCFGRDVLKHLLEDDIVQKIEKSETKPDTTRAGYPRKVNGKILYKTKTSIYFRINPAGILKYWKTAQLNCFHNLQKAKIEFYEKAIGSWKKLAKETDDTLGKVRHKTHIKQLKRELAEIKGDEKKIKEILNKIENTDGGNNFILEWFSICFDKAGFDKLAILGSMFMNTVRSMKVNKILHAQVYTYKENQKLHKPLYEYSQLLNKYYLQDEFDMMLLFDEEFKEE